MTYAVLDQRSDALARGLASLGIRRGDRVGVLMRNRPELLEAIDQTSRNSRTARVKNETESGQPFFIAHN